MAPLFKKKDKTTIAELEEYYANQNKRRSSTAWLMALLSILITVAVIVALFFAGRWLYRTFIEDDPVVVDTTQTGSEEDSVNLPDFDSEELGSDRGVGFTEGETNNPDDLIINEDEVVDSQDVATNDGTVSDEAATTDVPNTDRLADQNGQIMDPDEVDAGDNNGTVAGANDIPDTGPGETVLVILMAVSLLGYLSARRFQLKK